MNKIQIVNNKFICPMSGNEISERGCIMFAACAKCDHNVLGQFVNKYVYCTNGSKSIPSLPSEYEVLKYIEMNGDNSNSQGQYIETPYSSKSNRKFVLDCILEKGSSGTSIAHSTYSWGTVITQGAKTIFRADASKNKIYLVYDEATEVSFQLDHKRHTYIIDYVKKECACDNEIKSFAGYNIKRYSDTLPFLIGAWYESGNGYYRTTGKFYRVEVYENNIQKIDLIPALKISTGEVGMYDAARNIFLTNKGTGTLGYMKNDGTYVAPKLI